MPLDLTPLLGSSETLTPLDSFDQEPGYTNPALYPSAASYPSAATFPSSGSTVDPIGLFLDAVSPDTQTLTPLTED